MNQMLKIAYRLYLSQRPVYLIQYVTSRCNLLCKHCFYLQQILSKDKDELTLNEFEKIAANFPGLIQLSIGGGEPLLRDDLAEIIYIFRKISDVQYFTLPTNATLPQKTEDFLHDILPRIQPAHLRMSMSLDGIGEEHDRIRGKSGTFQKFLSTWAKVSPLRRKYRNFSLDIVATVSTLNQNHISALFDYCLKNFDPDNLGLLYVRGDVDNAIKQGFLELYGELANRLEKINAGIRENRSHSSLLRAVSSGVHRIVKRTVVENQWQLPCEAGRKLLVISEKGDVYPCEILKDCYGNLREHDYDLASIISQPEVSRKIALIKQSRCYCTFECAHSLNSLYHRKADILLHAAKYFLHSKCLCRMDRKESLTGH